MTKNIEESRRLARHRAVRAKAKQCYYNAFRVVTNVPEYADADYVEGIAIVDGGLYLEHGWVERDDDILDPTLPDDEAVYFPGLRFSGQTGIAEGLKIPKPKHTREDLPIFYRFGWGGGDSPEFCKARRDSLAYVNSLLATKAG